MTAFDGQLTATYQTEFGPINLVLNHDPFVRCWTIDTVVALARHCGEQNWPLPLSVHVDIFTWQMLTQDLYVKVAGNEK